jgi:hypothetical protein
MEERPSGRGRKALAWVGGQTRHDNKKDTVTCCLKARMLEQIDQARFQRNY